MFQKSISFALLPLFPNPVAIHPVEGWIIQYNDGDALHPLCVIIEPGLEVFKRLIDVLMHPGLGDIVKFGVGGVFIIIGPIVEKAGGKHGFVVVIDATNEFVVVLDPIGILPQEDVL